MDWQRFLCGIPAEDYVFQDESYEVQIRRAKDMIKNADAVIIGARAGASTAAGICYGGKRFTDNFAEFIDKYGKQYMTDMYAAGFYPFPTEEAKWGYWSKHALMNRFIPSALPMYLELFDIVKDKEYFVLTTNVDHQFWKAGFGSDRIFATQGDYGEIGSTDKCGTGVNVQTHLVAMHHVDCPWKPSSIEQREGRGIRQGNENDEVAVYRYVTKGTFDAYSWSLVENKQRFISQVMTSKSVSRTCEDIDEATLSYAEIKAVATGNPMIREKMEIDNDVQRLKLLKASYDSQRYSLQDNFMIRFPKLIKAAEEKLVCVREDLKARDAALLTSAEFAITVGNVTFTERTDGGASMLEAVSKCKTGETSPIGSFKGFELLVEKNFMGVNYLVLRGRTEYKAELSTSPVGNMVKLENLFNGIDENIDFLEKKIESYKLDMEASKAEYEKPFAYEEELKAKIARQYELNAQLDLENGKVEDVDLAASEDKDIARNVAEEKGPYRTGGNGYTR